MSYLGCVLDEPMLGEAMALTVIENCLHCVVAGGKRGERRGLSKKLRDRVQVARRK